MIKYFYKFSQNILRSKIQSLIHVCPWKIQYTCSFNTPEQGPSYSLGKQVLQTLQHFTFQQE